MFRLLRLRKEYFNLGKDKEVLKCRNETRIIEVLGKECKWSERSGIMNEGIHVSPRLFGPSFLVRHHYVSCGSEGDIKTGHWWRVGLANPLPLSETRTTHRMGDCYL